MSMARYAPVFDPGCNSNFVDTSDTSNPAPKGVRVKAKSRIRRAGKASMRQKSEKEIRKEMTSL